MNYPDESEKDFLRDPTCSLPEGATDKDASLILGKSQGMLFGIDDGHFDGLLMLCQYAMENAPRSNLGHTMSHKQVLSLTFNGLLLGEIGVEALIAGLFDIPFLFLSGDRAACLNMPTSLMQGSCRGTGYRSCPTPWKNS